METKARDETVTHCFALGVTPATETEGGFSWPMTRQTHRGRKASLRHEGSALGPISQVPLTPPTP